MCQNLFSNCSSLTDVILSYGVTEIQYGAFLDCASLKNITIPSSVTSITALAFEGCPSLEYNEYNNGLYLGNDENPYHVLIKAKSGEIDSLVVNDDCKIIAGNALNSCKSLTEVTFGNCETTIRGGAFYNCTSLTNVSFGNGAISIERDAFSNCTSLTNVDISRGVASIGGNAFDGCNSLTSITIGDSGPEIRNDTFYGCSSINTIIYIGTIEQWSNKGIDWSIWTLFNLNITTIICSDGTITI